MANEMTVQKTESLSNSEAFTNKVLKEFGSNVAGSIQVTDYQRQLIQGYFIATDRALKMAEEKRVSKNENNKDHKWDNPDPINWNTVDLNALAWTLSMGTDIGGSGTPIGASANVAGTAIAAREGYAIGWGRYCKYSAPAAVIVLAISMVMLLLRY